MTAYAERTGNFLNLKTGDESYRAYIPKTLPPLPALEMGEIYPLLDKATVALGRLDGMSSVLPDAELFLYMYVRKEALLSSQIEGTQSSLSDLLLFENKDTPGVPIDDVSEVSCYVAAMNHGLKRIKEGFPVSLRLFREIHKILLSQGRGREKQPGEFRTSQNWIGGTRPGNAKFVPPPPDKVMECLGDFEKYLHNDKDQLPTLVKAALAHVQFETIHPFLDGNGRLGRLLITLLLCTDGLMSSPLLYLSLYFKIHRQEYYEHLQNVRVTGDWEAWVKFFLTGVIDTSEQATEAARKIVALFKKDLETIKSAGTRGGSIMVVHNYLQRKPLTSATRIAEETGISFPSVLKALGALEKLGIVRETSGRTRHRVYAYQGYMDLLNKGTEPL